MEKGTLKIFKRDEIERCVNCNKKTIYTRNTPISKRMHYVEGAGQLCPSCWIKVYD